LWRESFGIVSARPQELTFFLLPLSQAYPWASTVLVDELDAGRLEGPSNRHFIGSCKRRCHLGDFRAPNRVHPQSTLSCEGCRAPFQKCARGPDLRPRERVILHLDQSSHMGYLHPYGEI
jgi:hypothetical protein